MDSNENQEDQPIAIIDQILQKRIVKGKRSYEYLVKWHDRSRQWVPEGNLRCPNLLLNFERRNLQRSIINRYNDEIAEKKSSSYGFQRHLPLEKFVGGLLLENIPVLEAKWRSVEEHDLVLWEEAREKYPLKLLEFCLNFLLFKQRCVVYSWGKFPNLPEISK